MIPDATLLFIAVLALLLFGNKLPSLMRKLGTNLAQIKRAMEETREHVRMNVEHAKPKAPQSSEPDAASSAGADKPQPPSDAEQVSHPS